jgi:hypothetical protein
MVVGPFAHNGCQYCHYGLMLSGNLDITQDASPAIGDILLMLIPRMGQQAYRLPFYMETWSITPLWIDVMMLLC